MIKINEILKKERGAQVINVFIISAMVLLLCCGTCVGRNCLITLGVRPDFFLFPLHYFFYRSRIKKLQQDVNQLCKQYSLKPHRVKMFLFPSVLEIAAGVSLGIPCIFVHRVLIKNLEHDELLFIMYHEIGHKVSRNRVDELLFIMYHEIGHKVSRNRDDEFAADKFAASHLDKQSGIDALTKTLNLFNKLCFLAPQTYNHYEARIAALKNG